MDKLETEQQLTYEEFVGEYMQRIGWWCGCPPPTEAEYAKLHNMGLINAFLNSFGM